MSACKGFYTMILPYKKSEDNKLLNYLYLVSKVSGLNKNEAAIRICVGFNIVHAFAI